MDDSPFVIGDADDCERLLVIIEWLLGIGSMDFEGALDEACDLVRDSLGSDVASALLLDAPTDSLVAAGLSAGEMGRWERASGMDRLPLANDGRTVAVYQTGVPRITEHAEDDASELPGLTRGRGVRSVFSIHPDRFSEADLRFLGLVAR